MDAVSLSVRDRCLAIRDSLIGNERFQRWAAAFPLTRPIARKRAGALFDLCAGFVYSQILLACVRLRLLDHLANGPQTAAALAQRMALPVESAVLLIDAAVALRLVAHRSAGRYGLGDLGAALAANPGIKAMIEHHAMLYADLGDPVALLRGEGKGGQLAHYWPYAGKDTPSALTEAAVAPYTALMSSSQPMIAQEAIRAYPFAKHRCLLDVGGGDGAFASAVAQAAPALHVMVFDLPAVADRAAARFTAAGLCGRATAVGGSFFTDPLPRGADIISLVRVIHDHDDEQAMVLLHAARAALPENGTLLVVEPLSGTRRAEAVGDAYFGFYLLAMGSGRTRTLKRLRDMLSAAGFGVVRPARTNMPLLTSVLVASASSRHPNQTEICVNHA